jgi:hypothetical protein
MSWKFPRLNDGDSSAPHLSFSGTASTAGEADQASSATAQSKILILTALRWWSVMRLALELSEVGFTVEAACPGGYQIEKMPFVKASYRYNALAPVSALRDTIMMSRPMLLVPCDDYVTSQLHELYNASRSSEPGGYWLRTLIVRSLGRPEHFSLLYSRYGIGSLARELNIPAPATEAVSASTLTMYLDSLGLPAVLKSDGSWSGKGVAIANSRKEAARAFHKLSAPPGVLLTLKRLTLNRDPTLVLRCLRRTRPAISMQRFVPGRPANAAVACWQGRVLACVLVEVLASVGATGAATVVRVISHPGMSRAVELMVERLELSGLCGFDFILGAEDGSAQLVEFNPRATQTSYLIAADGKDLFAQLYGVLRNSEVTPRATPCLEPLALFPYKATRHFGERYTESAIHDIPWRSPELIRLGLGRKTQLLGRDRHGPLRIRFPAIVAEAGPDLSHAPARMAEPGPAEAFELYRAGNDSPEPRH